MNNEATFQNWDRGDIIRHKATGDAYVVDANYGEHLTAVRTAMVSNAHEWERVFESIPMGDVDDCAVKLDGFGVPVHHISGRISFDPSKTAYAPDKGPVNVGDPVGRKDTLATRIAELREKTTAQIDDLTARNDHLVTRNGVLETEVSVLTKDNDCLERVIKTSAEEMRGKDREIDIKQDAIDAQERTITRLAKKKREASGCVYDLPEALEGTAPRHFRLGDVFDATIDLGSIEEITGPDLVGDGWGFTLYKRGDTTGFHWKCYDTEQAAREAYARLTAALCGEE